MPLADGAELDEGDQPGAEDSDEVAAETHDDAGQPDDAEADGDDGIQHIDLLGMELVKQIEDPQCDGEQSEGEQQCSSRDQEWTAAPANPGSRLHRRQSYGGSSQAGAMAAEFSLD